MKRNFESEVTLFGKKYDLAIAWQDLRFGFRRAVIYFESPELFHAIINLCCRKSHWNVSTWSCYEGEFEGYIYLMDGKDYTALSDCLAEEKRKNDEWWQRYHEADAETKRLMACGAIE